MAEQKIKFKVSIKELSFEFEGTREVGQALQAGLSRSLSGLMDTQRTVMLPATALPPIPEPVNGGEGGANPGVETPANGQPAEKVKKPRKINGVSLIGLLRDLKTERYFAEARSADSIRDKLKTKGHTFSASNIAARLQDLTKKDELYRQQSGDGYVYKDTPFDESARTPNPSDEPAE